MKTTRTCRVAVMASAVSALALTASAQESATSLADALMSGDAGLDFRYRYEYVDQDNFSENANASTLLMRLNYKTGTWANWSGFVEFDYIGEVLVNDFNNGVDSSDDRDQYPAVLDPKGPDLNQVYVDYAAAPDLLLRLGRQRIVLDNQRFVGGVAWRQNEQTFDGASVSYNGWANTKFFYSYVSQVRRILGERSSAGSQDVDAHLLNAKIGLNDDWSVTPYIYYIDNEDAPANSTSTYGARLDGKLAVGDGSLGLQAEFASQSDAGNAPVSYDAQYLHLGASWAMKNGLSLGIDFESLGGDANQPGSAFRTPLATLHAFQGWADLFLATPAAGIDDLFVNVKYSVAKWQLQAIYHDFSAESGSGDFGTEIDLAGSRKLNDRYSLLLKAAFFSSDAAPYPDTTKFWVMLSANF
ncbi:MAG: alginate export family protein [Gammaproteobacteria bacterium]|nr:alginate export family protein [Gammaproteobacteria bacterium]MDH4254366.1 alginate export family protein [Gammaproteobacteria bacterium]MDH5309383.1 alginate export family protein [Gammaproteobacteria bacterium]